MLLRRRQVVRAADFHDRLSGDIRTHNMQGAKLVSTHSIDTENQSATQSAAKVAANPKFSAFLAAMLGLVIVFGVGFAPIDVVHNAAHDGRHSLSVPCH